MERILTATRTYTVIKDLVMKWYQGVQDKDPTSATIVLIQRICQTFKEKGEGVLMAMVDQITSKSISLVWLKRRNMFTYIATT